MSRRISNAWRSTRSGIVVRFPAGVGPSTIAGMIEKGWIVPENAMGRKYRVTDGGVEAVRRKIPSN
ncbi:hypothetical protein MTX20_25415 [Bradyrhizobium sp. ISRA435]|nr:hypothetical protein MTX20_25415 [Bradyrhizobium sp. ISRA435]